MEMSFFIIKMTESFYQTSKLEQHLLTLEMRFYSYWVWSHGPAPVRYRRFFANISDGLATHPIINFLVFYSIACLLLLFKRSEFTSQISSADSNFGSPIHPFYSFSFMRVDSKSLWSFLLFLQVLTLPKKSGSNLFNSTWFFNFFLFGLSEARGYFGWFDLVWSSYPKKIHWGMHCFILPALGLSICLRFFIPLRMVGIHSQIGNWYAQNSISQVVKELLFNLSETLTLRLLILRENSYSIKNGCLASIILAFLFFRKKNLSKLVFDFLVLTFIFKYVFFIKTIAGHLRIYIPLPILNWSMIQALYINWRTKSLVLIGTLALLLILPLASNDQLLALILTLKSFPDLAKRSTATTQATLIWFDTLVI